MKKILVPTDFSECAKYAAEVAASIAKKTGARIYLLHALDVPQYSRNDSFATMTDTAEGIFLMKYTKQNFAKLLREPFFEGVNVGEVVQFENAYETITQQAKEHDIDMIVMGSHGTSGFDEQFIGSTAEKVIRLANCPVLTIKKQHTDFAPKNLVYASNFYGESTEGFEKVRKFAKIFGTEVQLLKVITPSNFETTPYSLELVESFAKEMKLENYTANIYNHHNIVDGVNEFCEANDVELIAMETHGRTGLSHLLKGSIAEDVTNHSKLPVFTTRIPKHSSDKGGIFPS
ncbi:MAG: universal stress protein [Flavobacteriales bacterium]|nr:universal stress protein [Flavobacteriales bacterium]